jgi:hypothetical protein
MATFGDILAEFKKMALGEAENIFPLIEDEMLTNGLIAWKSVKVIFKKLSDCPYTDDVGKWDWLWDNVDFDMSRFAVVSGSKAQDASSLFLRLKGLRLIYPDGTINLIAKQYLQSQIMGKIRGIAKPVKTPPSNVPDSKTDSSQK